MTRHSSSASQPDLTSIENRLAGTLQRVSPPGDLAQRLRGRLRVPAREEIVSRLGDWRRLMLILTGVISGTVVIITLGRALYYLAVRREPV